MLIYNENQELIDIEEVEQPEQDLANNFIRSKDIVLELGARYGSVSCVINNKLSDKTQQVVVEPDARVWDALEFNKTINNSKFNIVKGFVSKKPANLTNLDCCWNGYGSTFVHDVNSKIPNYSLDEIKAIYNIKKFTALVADCEGFLETFFDENPELYDELDTVIFEADYPEKCNYDIIRKRLKEKGFKRILEGFQNVWLKDLSIFDE